MRIVISHGTIYRYERPASGIIQTLRLSPRNHDGQYVVSWRIHISADCPLIGQEDAFGNLTHTFSTETPLDELTVRVEGEVDTEDTQGVIRDAVERFPPSLFLRETPLTELDESIAQFAAQSVSAAGTDDLTRMHAMLTALNTEIAFDTDPTHTATTASEAFTLKRGVCQDITHIFIAAARSLGIPARYVSGYFHRADGVVEQEAGHAWAEAFIPNLGWVGFDATNGICATEAHLRVAVGLDYLSAAPVRGTRTGGGAEDMSVRVRVDQAMQQTQN
jgi:transglutaminase-like putative cysteine protease